MYIYVHEHIYTYICIRIYVYVYTYIHMRMSAKVSEWHKRPLLTHTEICAQNRTADGWRGVCDTGSV